MSEKAYSEITLAGERGQLNKIREKIDEIKKQNLLFMEGLIGCPVAFTTEEWKELNLNIKKLSTRIWPLIKQGKDGLLDKDEVKRLNELTEKKKDANYRSFGCKYDFKFDDVQIKIDTDEILIAVSTFDNQPSLFLERLCEKFGVHAELKYYDWDPSFAGLEYYNEKGCIVSCRLYQEKIDRLWDMIKAEEGEKRADLNFRAEALKSWLLVNFIGQESMVIFSH